MSQSDAVSLKSLGYMLFGGTVAALGLVFLVWMVLVIFIL